MPRASRCGLSNTVRKLPPRKSVSAAMLFTSFRNAIATETTARMTISAVRLIYAAEQSVESDDQQDKTDRRGQASDNAGTEKHLVTQNVIRRRGGVPWSDQSAWNMDQAEGGGYSH